MGLRRLLSGLLFGSRSVETETAPEELAQRETKADPRAFETLSDGEFAIALAETFLSGPTPAYIEGIQGMLAERTGHRASLVLQYFDEKLARTPPSAEGHDGSSAWLMGTPDVVTPAIWADRRKALGEALSTKRIIPRTRQVETDGHVETDRQVEPDRYLVTAIASMYKAGEFIESFLENITSQTIFDQTELIIIDADSPDGEEDCIRSYIEKFPENIVYVKLNYRAGVYEAWNLAAKMGRGRYFTNTNMDDLRRADSLELQANAFLENKDIDVVYQDFLLTFDRGMSVEAIEAMGFKSNLPLVTPHNLLAFNSPHNAPMWKRQLHDDVGFFDTAYRSAADWDFWLRCISQGKTFFKLNEAHAIYFQNPQGISTRPDTRGVSEAARIATTYGRKLIAKELRATRAAFIDCVRLPGYPDLGVDAFDGRHRFDIVHDRLVGYAAAMHPRRRRAPAVVLERPKIRMVVDGVFFQLANDGTARLWRNVLTLFARQKDRYDVVLLDRGNCPHIDGVAKVAFPSYTFTNTADDSLLLQAYCDRLDADIFMSTSYTTPTRTPSVAFLCDMIPELMNSDLSQRRWREKQLAITRAYSIACVSQQTREDACRLYPYLEHDAVRVAQCGVDRSVFHRRSDAEVAALQLSRNYLLVVGSGARHDQHENVGLLFEALKLRGTADFDVVCVGGDPVIPSGWLEGLPEGVRVTRPDLDDDALACAYSGACALVFLPLFEGVGLPVLEAMACACPVITTALGSLQEVGGDAAIYISGRDPEELNRALDTVQQHGFREELGSLLTQQAGKFSWNATVEALDGAIVEAVGIREASIGDPFAEAWQRLRRIQARVDWPQIMPGG